jgi:CheY-like chemotaxis protein
MKILIVEDSSSKLHRIQNILEKHGIEYDVATNGKDALEMCREHQYKVGILDIEFPWEDEPIKGYTGMEMMRIFDKEKRDIKVIVYSIIPVEEIWKRNGEELPNCFAMQAVFPFQLEREIYNLKLQLE